jgi:hypothetical protein
MSCFYKMKLIVMKQIFFYLLFGCCLVSKLLFADEIQLSKSKTPFVIGNISCQMGNNLFQVAATLGYAWDHHIEAFFPGLAGNIPHLQHVFFRCNTNYPESKLKCTWAEPSHRYHPIPFKKKCDVRWIFSI